MKECTKLCVICVSSLGPLATDTKLRGCLEAKVHLQFHVARVSYAQMSCLVKCTEGSSSWCYTKKSAIQAS